MAQAETGPSFIPAQDIEPQLNLIEGDGTDVWSRTPEEFKVNRPITASLFAGSNLVRNLHDAEKTIRVSKGKGNAVETKVIPKTSRAEIIMDVYRHCLPKIIEDKESRELAFILGGEASTHEYDYEELGYANDPETRAELLNVIKKYSDSLLMQGFEAMIEYAYEYDGGLHEPLIRDAQIFGAYLISLQANE